MRYCINKITQMKQFISAHDVTDINALVAKALKYKDFLVHVYKTFDDKINSCKVEKIKNKYKKMRVDALKYIVANEKSIETEIFKRK